MSQHANAFSETLSQTVVGRMENRHDAVDRSMATDIVSMATGIRPGIVTESFKGPGTKTEIGTRPGTMHVQGAGRVSSLLKSKDSKDPNRTVLTGKALKDWIIDKGFDGKTTKLQRDCPKDRKGPNKIKNK